MAHLPSRSFPGLPLEALADRLGSAARARAAVAWLHRGPPPAALPSHVPGIAAGAWERLRASCEMPRFAVRARTAAPDGTTKLALDLDGATVETVLIPAEGRSTVCVSSQAGCTRRCAFCATASLGFVRNLEAGEIVLQFLLAAAAAPPGAPARNVVFMGMGEPMDNLDEVLAATRILAQAPAPQLRAGRITVSTSGVLPGLVRFLAESPASLALSLNGTTDEQRAAIMPQTKVWPIGALLGALREAEARAPGRTVFVEYVLLDGVNDAPEDAARLAPLLAGLRATVNLIPHNPFAGSPFRPTPRAKLDAFRAAVRAAGLPCFTRWPRGGEVAAACGQLALVS